MRVLIAVTHLLGAGHLTRAAALARALAEAGHAVVLASGGAPAPLVRSDGVRLVQLPPLHVAGTAFSTLLTADGSAADGTYRDRREAMLLDLLGKTAPDVVVTELFPFGRRALEAEFLALVGAARARRPRPLIFASVRDILVAPDKAAKVVTAHARIAQFYDAVLVHGDEALAPLEASWPVDDALRVRLRYTGYIDAGEVPLRAGPRDGVVAAAGSGDAGCGLFRAAAEAARLKPDLPWRIRVGHGVPEDAFRAVSQGLPEGIVSRAGADYRAQIAGAALSVSQCGYNTAVDLLVTGTPAVVVPFEAGRETEQRLRAERLAARGLARVLPEADLSGEALLAAVTAAMSASPPGPHGIDLDGAARSVAIIEELAARAAAEPPGRVLATIGVTVVREGGSNPGITAPEGPRGTGRPAARTPEVSLEGAVAKHPGAAIVRPCRKPSGFDGLSRALDGAAERGAQVTLWWRDDDAVAATPALDRLLELAEQFSAPIMLAAIPARVEPSLPPRLRDAAGVSLAVHGLAHSDHAPPGAKAAEFGPHRLLATLRAEAEAALGLAREKLPAARLLPVFVPPWNRIAPDLADVLPGLGYTGLSAAGGPPVAGLVRADATLDPIDWRGTRSLRDPDALLDDLAGQVASGSGRPIGLLTHHLAHDEAIWGFVAVVLATLSRHPAVRIRDPRHLFGAAAVDAGADHPKSEVLSEPEVFARARVG